MFNSLRNSVLIAAFVAGVPMLVQEKIQAGGNHCCCQTCRQPCGRCCCAQQRDVAATEYRTEAVVETVPATVVENVTVDEGSYQTVWVPRLTTKAVARTTYQTRTAYRSVPYQVTHRVSECVTPNGTFQAGRSFPVNGTMVGSYPLPTYASTIGTPIYGSSPIAAGTYPTLATSPSYPTPVAAGSSTYPSTGVPDPRFADTPVTSIAPRNATSSSRYGSSAADTRTAARGPSLFVPAPSAAQAWRSSQNSSLR
jgi:hypothetical protein